MKVYASISYNEEYKEWINLVITDDGTPVSCNAFDNEKDCRQDMVEGSKLKLNQRFAVWNEDFGDQVPSYEIIVLDKKDPFFLKVMELNDIHQINAKSFKFKIINGLSLKWLKFRHKMSSKFS